MSKLPIIRSLAEIGKSHSSSKSTQYKNFSNRTLRGSQFWRVVFPIVRFASFVLYIISVSLEKEENRGYKKFKNKLPPNPLPAALHRRFRELGGVDGSRNGWFPSRVPTGLFLIRTYVDILPYNLSLRYNASRISNYWKGGGWKKFELGRERFREFCKGAGVP